MPKTGSVKLWLDVLSGLGVLYWGIPGLTSWAIIDVAAELFTFSHKKHYIYTKLLVENLLSPYNYFTLLLSYT